MNGLLPVLTRNGFFARPTAGAFDRLFEDFGKIDRETREEWTPALDVAENETEYIVEAEVPGLTKEEIDITLTEGLLTIKGEKKQEVRQEADNRHIVERTYGTFLRALRLPATIDQTKVTATTKDGVLTITIPKAEEIQPKKIEING